jgi:two-component system sensor histidine kinase KdpD
VDEAVAQYRQLHGIDQPWETKERVVIALAGAAGGEVVVRRAARLAMRSGAELVGLFVRPTHELSEEEERVLPAQRELLEQLGGRYQEVVGDDVGASLLAFAKAENATQIVLGASRRSRLAELIHGSPIARVIRDAGDVDVHVISYESAAKPTRRMSRRPDNAIGGVRIGLAWAIAAIGLPLVTWLLLSVGGSAELYTVLFVYLLLAVATGSIGGALPAVATAVAGFLLANWYFAHPVRTLTIADPDQLFALFAFLVVSSTVGLLVGLTSRRSAEARRARAQAEALAATTTVGHPVFVSDLDVLLRRVREVLALDAVSVMRRSGDNWEVLAWDGSEALENQSDGSDSISLTGDTSLVILGGRLTADDRTVLRAFAAQMVQAIERTRLEIEVESAESIAETDRLRTALLRAVSHDLRTPLATIKASLTSLLETQVAWTPEETVSFLEIALEETERLNRLVGRLLDASRVQVGAVHVLHRTVGLDEVVTSALSGFRADAERLEVEISEELPEVDTDPDLLERVLANLVENALTWSPPDRAVRITAGAVAGRIDLRIGDRGPGIPREAREQVFQPFQRLGDSAGREGVGLGLAVARGLLEAMGNELIIEDTPGGGTTMVIALQIPGVEESPADTAARAASNA